MAIIIPYGDTNAHGSLGGSISFRRRFGKVVLQKQPFPVQPNTPAQIIQRDAFASVQNDWYSYNAISKGYFNIRAPQYGWTAKNLFTSAKLKSIMPNLTAPGINRILQAQVVSPQGVSPNETKFEFFTRNKFSHTWSSQGTIYDNENVFVWSGLGQVDVDGFKVEITGSPGYPVFRYGIWLQIRLWPSTDVEWVMRLREVPTGASTFYMSLDGSTFFDFALSELNATNNF